MVAEIEVMLWLLVAVAALALLARKISVPYPILLVLGGLVLALIPGIPKIRLEPRLIFVLFLPPLLYPAALFTSWRDFRANLRPIILLAVGLVLFTTCSVGWFAHYMLVGLPLAAAFALGAIISPPDAVAATAVLERLQVPQRIVTVVEGESLVNDATALVAYGFAIEALNHGTFSLAQAGVKFIVVSVGGIGFGLLIGWLASHVQRRLDDPPVQVTISLLTPYAAYLPADHAGVSGVLAVVAAGVYLGWRAPEIINSRMRLQAGPVWEMVVFLLNGVVFILIGLQLPEVVGNFPKTVSMSRLCWEAMLISALVIVVRFIWVFVATYLPRLISKKLRERDPYPGWRPVVIVAWTGMRGVVSLAAALALPLALADGTAFPGRNTIIFITFVVILVTLVLQGLSLPFLIRWLKVEDGGETEQEERQARLKANQAALARLAELEGNGHFPVDLLQRLRVEYDDRVRQLEACQPVSDGPRRLLSSAYEELQQEALRVERQTILQLRNERFINDHALRRIQRDLDLAEARLRREN
jgi:CPA1 family monovalent cation:H+ antiporter